ncbi:hypothetical protein [Cryptosporangium phraense]|uniref:Uncharacterized protein n=1 Tax=Cryptosporangium phraense TaxID=2593070 RepID=A0A545AM97_9ACTN|nr:hypothetical protein [Cryptosporangium phraense]TQS42437.1 hypothetical protein FL583_24325 [Cryptosporangium phraense]
MRYGVHVGLLAAGIAATVCGPAAQAAETHSTPQRLICLRSEGGSSSGVSVSTINTNGVSILVYNGPAATRMSDAECAAVYRRSQRQAQAARTHAQEQAARARAQGAAAAARAQAQAREAVRRATGQ